MVARLFALSRLCLRFTVLFTVLLCASASFAQNSGNNNEDESTKFPGSDAPFEVGFHLGSLLPNQITGVTEIMGLGGGRMGIRLSPQTYFETGFITGNGEDQQWKNVHADLRMDIPVQTLVGVAFVGADTVYYKGRTGGTKLIFGGHAGGGIQTHLAGSAWFRADMKFGFSPGTSLYIGFGFVWRLGSGGAGGADQALTWRTGDGPAGSRIIA
ncbi:MAG: hypothetical protein HC902_11580 [Calothrix sp. SM1_5_4]|nr:hypothetical protein [Calothrix sp. SM1_5_4]